MKKMAKGTVRNPRKPGATAKPTPLRSTLDRALIRSGTLAPLIWLLLLLLSPSPTPAVQNVIAHADVSLTATETDFHAAEKVSPSNPIDWDSDVNWEITVKSLNANLGSSGGYTKPLSDLKWRLSIGGTWTSMTTTDATVKTGSAGSGSFNVDYKFLLSWSSDIAGLYGCTVQYTISAP